MRTVQLNRVSKTSPFVVEGEIPIEEFDAFMTDNCEECFAREPIQYSGCLTLKKDGILLETKVSAQLWLDCVRCNKRDPFTLNFDAKTLLVAVADSPKSDEIVLGADDLDVAFYDNNEVDIHHFILESIWSEVDTNHLCSDDCRGLCQICGKNLNEGDCGCNKFN